MTDYFKATRPDGTDFRTGTVNYGAALTSGEVLRHPAKSVKGDPSTYFSVATVATDCTGMKWPCRLFRVKPVGRALRATENLPNKRRLSALRVVEELPAHEVFGPQGADVVAVIERARALTVDEAQQMHLAWEAASHLSRDAARDAAWAARDAARDAAWVAARDAAWVAACAYLVRDLITDGQFQDLAGPWLQVIGEVSRGE